MDAVAWGGDDLEPPALPSKAAVAHACLLAGDLDAAQTLAAQEQVLGWSSGENTQGLVVPFFLGLSTGRSFTALPPNLAQLWQAGLQTRPANDVRRRRDCLSTPAAHLRAGRLKRPWDHNTQEMFLAWCLDVARQRVESIVSNQRGAVMARPRTLTVACAEALRLGGNASGGNAFLETIRTRFPRHSAFQAELRSAIALMERGK